MFIFDLITENNPSFISIVVFEDFDPAFCFKTNKRLISRRLKY